METDVKITAATNRTLEQFQRLIEQRKKWLNESTRDSVAAIAITALRSVRAATRVANENKIPDIDVKLTSFIPSVTQQGGHKQVCLRNSGHVRYTLGANERLVSVVKNVKDMFVFKYIDKRKNKTITYYIIAATHEDAENAMKQRIAKRIKAWKGLARKALSVLMYKACTVKDADQVNPKVSEVANGVTTHNEIDDGVNYTLTMSDMLDYATLAVEGGNGIVDMSLKKAANKAASVINQKCGHGKLFNFEPIETPFPEVSKRRG